MIDGALITVVVPARDEASWIAEVVTTMPSFVDLVVIVDDGSTDDTAARARAAATGAELVVLTKPCSEGVGAALVAGYAYAAQRGAAVTAVMAGDGQMDPADLRAVIDPVLRGEADYVKGNRLVHPAVWQAMPKARLFGSLVLSKLTSWAAGVPIVDSQCGYTALSARALQRVDLATMWPRFGYPNDLIGLITRASLSIAEVPVRPVYRGERSLFRAWHLAGVGYVIGRLGLRRLAAARGGTGGTRKG
ncbi:MAG: glycosyltransferase family 2 protein [Deltaproteobacteria bacterium]|nr:glycosyltransferase family 2 protein [Deltaproteobacteria bacterium]